MQDPVTNRYADALFGLAKSQGVLDAVSANVETLAREMSSTSSDFYFDARVSIEARREKLRSTTTSMHGLTQNFVNLLFDKRREEVLRDLGTAFHRRALDERHAAEGVVESARLLGAAEISRVATAVGARLGKSVSLENRVTEEVLGGVRVTVLDDEGEIPHHERVDDRGLRLRSKGDVPE